MTASRADTLNPGMLLSPFGDLSHASILYYYHNIATLEYYIYYLTMLTTNLTNNGKVAENISNSYKYGEGEKKAAKIQVTRWSLLSN